jgi:hypothetical protein
MVQKCSKWPTWEPHWPNQFRSKHIWTWSSLQVLSACIHHFSIHDQSTELIFQLQLLITISLLLVTRLPSFSFPACTPWGKL